jgi:hypothetical protein
MSSATQHLDQLRTALDYAAPGKSRREIGRIVAEQTAAAEVAAREVATARRAAEAAKLPKRYCAWCGDDTAGDVAGDFCSENCAKDDAADAAANPREPALSASNGRLQA